MKKFNGFGLLTRVHEYRAIGLKPRTARLLDAVSYPEPLCHLMVWMQAWISSVQMCHFQHAPSLVDLLSMHMGNKDVTPSAVATKLGRSRYNMRCIPIRSLGGALSTRSWIRLYTSNVK